MIFAGKPHPCKQSTNIRVILCKRIHDNRCIIIIIIIIIIVIIYRAACILVVIILLLLLSTVFDDEEENKLPYMDIHNEYKKVVSKYVHTQIVNWCTCSQLNILHKMDFSPFWIRST